MPYRAALNRPPTFPPSTSRRRTYFDTTFTNDGEFHLFAEATVGLGPEQVFRHSPSSSDLSENMDTNIRGHAVLPPIAHQQLTSPIQETPTTVFALQQLAQLPQASPNPQCQRPGFSQRAYSHRSDASTTNVVDSWLHSLSDDYDEDVDAGLVEEELPDYAASQAQAEMAQRLEATRRAQELQWRWQQSR